MVALHLIYHKMYLTVKRFFGQFAFSFEATRYGQGSGKPERDGVAVLQSDLS
jgi:hypothetical protein